MLAAYAHLSVCIIFLPNGSKYLKILVENFATNIFVSYCLYITTMLISLEATKHGCTALSSVYPDFIFTCSLQMPRESTSVGVSRKYKFLVVHPCFLPLFLLAECC